MLSRKTFKNLPTVVAISVLFEQFSDRFCFLSLILSALANMMRFVSTFSIV